MLGRGALADPTLGRKAACELGIPGSGLLHSFGRTPVECLPLISRYVELCSASGRPPAYILARVKQWLRMTHQDGKLTWFDTLKGYQNLGELLHHLGRQAGDFPPSPCAFSRQITAAGGKPAA